MSKMTTRIAPALCATLALSVAALAADPVQTYKIDPAHTSVTFSIRHLVTRVQGQFREVAGTITVDRQNPAASSVTFTIQAASVDTRIEQRDKHLRSADFFDVEKYPQITFASKKIVPKDTTHFDVTGDFTMHGVTKEITVPVEFLGDIKDPWGNDRAGFSVTATLNRKDYGIVWNKALDQGGMMLGDDVDVDIQIESVRKPAQPAQPAPNAPGKS
jgi:polyisoprenoid-binding protein YceI